MDAGAANSPSAVSGAAVAPSTWAASPSGDGGVVRGGGGVDLDLQAAARLERGGAVIGAHLGKDGVVIGGVGHHGHGGSVLRGGAQHGGAADVDVLDGVGKGDVGVGDGLLELVEVHADEVDHADAVLGSLGHMLLGVATGEQAAVDLGVQRLDAALHHLGEAGVLLNRDDGNAGLDENLGGAAGGDDLNTKLLRQRLRELNHAGLVRNRNQRARNLSKVCHVPSFAGVTRRKQRAHRYPTCTYCTAGGKRSHRSTRAI
mgnify:CR=1 FL=1